MPKCFRNLQNSYIIPDFLDAWLSVQYIKINYKISYTNTDKPFICKEIILQADRVLCEDYNNIYMPELLPSIP